MRARTRPGRLAFSERWVERFETERLRDLPRVVDFGFGERPVTSGEWALALNARSAELGRPKVTVFAVEVDETRVAAARAEGAAPGVELVRGGFEALATFWPVAVVRAMNVLRGYRAGEVAAAHEALVGALGEGGVALEGSCDTEGHVTAFLTLRRDAASPGHRREALVFHTDFSRGFSPWLFRDWLPRDLRRSVSPGTPIHTFFTQWHSAFGASAQSGLTLAQRFTASVQQVPHLTWLEPGAAQWQPPDGIPAGEA